MATRCSTALRLRSNCLEKVAFLREHLDEDWHPMLDELERLMAVATERVHRYLWFVGD